MSASGPPRRPHLTSRAAILAVVVCAIVLSLGYPVREYIAQHQRIGQLRAQEREHAQRIDALQERKRRLNDPDYIEREARERLHYVMPGETGYVVVDGRHPSHGGTDDAADAPAESRPWYVNLWKSVKRADGSR